MCCITFCIHGPHIRDQSPTILMLSVESGDQMCYFINSVYQTMFQYIVFSIHLNTIVDFFN